jgi:hypothetical protein
MPIDPAIATEIAALDESMAMARAAFDGAESVFDSTASIAGKRKIEIAHIELGAARAMINATRLRLLGRLMAPRLLRHEALTVGTAAVVASAAAPRSVPGALDAENISSNNNLRGGRKGVDES